MVVTGVNQFMPYRISHSYQLDESISNLRVVDSNLQFHSNCILKANSAEPGPEVIKLISYSTELSTKFILLINVKMPTIVGILTLISMINTALKRLKAKHFFFVGSLVFMSS